MKKEQKGVVSIRGKEYQTVAKRVSDFRALHSNLTIETDIVSASDLVCIKALIRDESGRLLSTGYAEEVRGSSNINNSSALENCETSAVGRALAFFGYGGEQIASANEVNDAMISSAKKEVVDYMANYSKVMNENFDSFCGFREGLANDDLAEAAGNWFDIPEDAQRVLYLAPTKGGIMTTKEREQIKTSYFRKAHFGDQQQNNQESK